MTGTMKCLWDEIGNLKQFPRCSCTEGMKDHKKNEEEDKLLQFLMGLNESYKSTRGSLLMMVPPPDINQAYSLILQEEKQRDIQIPSQISTESASMFANGKPGQSSSQKARGDASKGDRRNLFCTNCKKNNHTADRCYFLIGFPPNYQNNKTQKTGQNEKFTAAAQSQLALTPDQITKLIGLLDATSGSKGKDTQHDDFAGFAVGKLAPTMKGRLVIGEADRNLYFCDPVGRRHQQDTAQNKMPIGSEIARQAAILPTPPTPSQFAPAANVANRMENEEGISTTKRRREELGEENSRQAVKLELFLPEEYLMAPPKFGVSNLKKRKILQLNWSNMDQLNVLACLKRR
ncbi:hypothetical protein V2J09_001421 [Rumex salicifolius]